MSREAIAQQLEEARGAFPDVRALAHEDGEVSFRLEGESLCFFYFRGTTDFLLLSNFNFLF